MSNKVERQGPSATIDDGSTIRLALLTSGTSFNGAPPLIDEQDVQTSIVDVRCYCGATVAVLWSNDRRARTGLPSFLFLQAQFPEDQTERFERVARTRIVETVVRPTGTHVVVCPVHGPQAASGSVLVNLARKTEAHIARGRERMGKYVLPRVSRS